MATWMCWNSHLCHLISHHGDYFETLAWQLPNNRHQFGNRFEACSPHLNTGNHPYWAIENISGSLHESVSLPKYMLVQINPHPVPIYFVRGKTLSCKPFWQGCNWQKRLLGLDSLGWRALEWRALSPRSSISGGTLRYRGRGDFYLRGRHPSVHRSTLIYLYPAVFTPMRSQSNLYCYPSFYPHNHHAR